MVDTGVEGTRIYKLIWKRRNLNLGATVVGICGGQGSVKTTTCLDIGEKIMNNNPGEKVFWRESIGSPIQFTRIIGFPYRIFVEKGLNLRWVNVTTKKDIEPEIYFFDDLRDLYDNALCQTLNVVFFKSRKSWTNLIFFCYNDKVAMTEWQTIIMDEMEDVYPADTDNQDEEKWWNWIALSGNRIKHCRKGYVTLVGNYHKSNMIDYRVRGKFMIFLYGFGAKVDAESRVKQHAVDKLRRGEFYIDEDHTRFGKIRIRRVHNVPSEQWTIKHT